MTSIQRTRSEVYLAALLCLLHELGPRRKSALMEQVAACVRPRDNELDLVGTRCVERWRVMLDFAARDLDMAGWITRAAGTWSITPAGETIVEQLPPSHELADRSALDGTLLADLAAARCSR